jgi:hypothetical protein
MIIDLKVSKNMYLADINRKNNFLEDFRLLRYDAVSHAPTLRGSIKIKLALEQAMKAQKGSGGIALLFLLISALDMGGWLTPRPGRFTPGKTTLFPLYRRRGGPGDRSGRKRKNLAFHGIRSSP